MDLTYSDEDEAFRAELRSWLEVEVPKHGPPPPPGDWPARRAYDTAWQRNLHDGGYAGVHWPKEYGGRGLPVTQQLVYLEEYARANAPYISVNFVGMMHAGPTLIAEGTDEQRAFHLPRILRGESVWCQGFSEPSAGSDLASLRTRAVREGDEYIVNGQKIWSTRAHVADYGELLVRTDPDVAKHKGITWVIMDMHLPGVDIRPIRAIDDYPHNCEVFYDEVRVPLANVVDKVNNGWSVALSTLAAERGPGFLDSRLAQIVLVDELIEHARSTGQLRDEALADRLAEARAMAAALRSMAYFQVSTAKKGEMPGSETTAIRTFFVQLEMVIGRLAVDVLGPKALEWQPWTEHWLSEFAGPIAGGTKDIQKNIIGERVLGLPR